MSRYLAMYQGGGRYHGQVVRPRAGTNRPLAGCQAACGSMQNRPFWSVAVVQFTAAAAMPHPALLCGRPPSKDQGRCARGDWRT